MTDKLMEKLKNLHARTKLSAEEENDEARKNEARTCAFLLLDIARKNGIVVKFEYAPGPRPQQPQQRYSGDPFRRQVEGDEFIRQWTTYVNVGVVAPDEVPFKAPATNPRRRKVNEDGAVLITAKLGGTCGVCGLYVQVGEKIWWRPGQRAAHEACGLR
jgi:hypothetical protein